MYHRDLPLVEQEDLLVSQCSGVAQVYLKKLHPE